MRCPICHGDDLATLDSRHKDGKTVRRKRCCKSCGETFYTRETFEKHDYRDTFDDLPLFGHPEPRK